GASRNLRRPRHRRTIEGCDRAAGQPGRMADAHRGHQRTASLPPEAPRSERMKNIGAGVGSVESFRRGASNAFDASNASPLLQKRATGVTLADVLDVFLGATVSEPRPIPPGHRVVLEAARAAGFPWLRLRHRVAVAGGEDGWRAWLEGWVSPAD